MPKNNIVSDKNKAQKASYCINCGQAYYRNRAKYNKDIHKFICPNCGH